MGPLMSLVLVFLAVLQVFSQTTIESHPYFLTVSGNFKSSPDYWLHATSVLRAHWYFEYVPLARRQYTDYWTSWKNISYLFALYVSPRETQTM